MLKFSHIRYRFSLIVEYFRTHFGKISSCWRYFGKEKMLVTSIFYFPQNYSTLSLTIWNSLSENVFSWYKSTDLLSSMELGITISVETSRPSSLLVLLTLSRARPRPVFTRLFLLWTRTVFAHVPLSGPWPMLAVFVGQLCAMFMRMSFFWSGAWPVPIFVPWWWYISFLWSMFLSGMRSFPTMFLFPDLSLSLHLKFSCKIYWGVSTSWGRHTSLLWWFRPSVPVQNSQQKTWSLPAALNTQRRASGERSFFFWFANEYGQFSSHAKKMHFNLTIYLFFPLQIFHLYLFLPYDLKWQSIFNNNCYLLQVLRGTKVNTGDWSS